LAAEAFPPLSARITQLWKLPEAALYVPEDCAGAGAGLVASAVLAGCEDEAATGAAATGAAATGGGAGIAASAARVSDDVTGGASDRRSRCPTWIMDGLGTRCRLIHHKAGQSAALPYACWLIELSVSPARTVTSWLLW
jgi:hypothetical protein